MATEIKREFHPKNMPFRRLGSSGLRVPLFSLGGCAYNSSNFVSNISLLTRGLLRTGLTFGDTVKGDPVVEIIKTAFENGINMFDTAEAYAEGESEKQM